MSFESPDGSSLDAGRDITEIPTKEPSTQPDESHRGLHGSEETVETEEDRILKSKVEVWVRQAFNYAEEKKAAETTDPNDRELRRKVLLWTRNISSFGKPTMSFINHAAEPTIEDPDVYVQEQKIQQWIREALTRK